MGFACIFGHKWNGCKCERCGVTRDEQHDWDGCKCRRCGKVRDEQHDWNGCICLRCGQKRDEQHKWNGFVCSLCGKKRSVNEITDQSTIADILINDDQLPSSMLVPLMRRVTDQSILISIAEKAKVGFFTPKILAVEKITDQPYLIKVARNDINSIYGRAAAQNITDQAILTELALGIRDKGNNTCWGGNETKDIIINRLSDQALLETIARKAENLYMRGMALLKIDDISVVTDIANGDIELACYAIEILTDLSLLVKIAENDKFTLERGGSRIRAYNRIIALNPKFRLTSKLREVKERIEVYEHLDKTWKNVDNYN